MASIAMWNTQRVHVIFIFINQPIIYQQELIIQELHHIRQEELTPVQATPPPAARATSGSLGASPSGPPKPPRPPGGYPGSGSRWKIWDIMGCWWCVFFLIVFVGWVFFVSKILAFSSCGLYVFNGTVWGQIVFLDGLTVSITSKPWQGLPGRLSGWQWEVAHAVPWWKKNGAEGFSVMFYQYSLKIKQ